APAQLDEDTSRLEGVRQPPLDHAHGLRAKCRERLYGKVLVLVDAHNAVAAGVATIEDRPQHGPFLVGKNAIEFVYDECRAIFFEGAIKRRLSYLDSPYRPRC